MEEEKPEMLFKVAVMGDASVGKTALIKRIVHNTFPEHYSLTHGVDFALKIHNLVERVVRFQFWDVGGAERFSNMMRVYLRETDAVILVWDATRSATFDALPKYFPLIKKGLPIIFVRSKADEDNKDKQDDFEARKKTIAEWTASRGMAPEDVAIRDTSSKDSLGIPELEKAMLDFVPQLIQKQEERENPTVVSRPVLREVLRVAAPVVPQTPSIFSERLDKIKHTRKPRLAELDTYFAKDKPTSKDIIWLLMHLDSVEKECDTAAKIRTYLNKFKIDIDHKPRLTEGAVVELLKLLDEEERRFAPKIITLLFFASYSDRKVAERDAERKLILDVAKNLHSGNDPYEGLDRNKVPKSVVDILAKHANRNIPGRK